jgi:adenylylsulfate kinase
MSKLLVKHGVTVVVCLISPYREIRRYAREQIGDLVEVWAKAGIETCIQRDPKGLYAKALSGEIKDMTGIQHPYEDPENPEVTLDTESQTPGESARAIIQELGRLGYLK